MIGSKWFGSCASLMCLVALPACSSGGGTGGTVAAGGSGATGSGGANGTGGTTGSNAPPPLDCGGILQCAAQCAPNDNACNQACYDRGTPAAQDVVTALVQCYQSAGCQDSTCLQTNCGSQLEACIAPSSSQPPTGQPPTQGSVPPDFVGIWSLDGATQPSYGLQFLADGSVERVRNIYVAPCQTHSDEKGIAVVNGNQLTLIFSQGDFDICGKQKSEPAPYQEVYTFTYETVTPDAYYPLGEKLTLVQQDCGDICDNETLAKIQ